MLTCKNRTRKFH